MGERNAGWVYRERIGERHAGATLIAHLVSTRRHSDAATWSRRIAAGQVRLDGETAVGGETLRTGQSLEWHRPPWVEAAVPLGFAILALDDDILAVAKPAGLPSVPAGGFLAHTLLARVRRRFPGATPMHRLGRGTSGVVLFARSARARRTLAAAWRRGAVERTYCGLACGHVGPEEQEIDVAIGRVSHPVLGELWAACRDGRVARTWVRGLATRRNDACSSADGREHHAEHTVVAIRLDTGRPHQIRIHLAAIGRPLCGDPLYEPGGVPAADARALPGDGGYWLHATAVAFPHPATGDRIVVECAPPPILRVGCRLVRGGVTP